MASGSTSSLNSASTHFFGSKVIISNKTHTQSMFVKFRPVSISAACSSTSPQFATSSRASSLYEVLGIQMGATYQEIKTAYCRLARVLHPDVTAANEYGGENENTGFEFMKVNEAYETLSDSQKRADYDLALYSRPRPLSSPFAMSRSPIKMASASGFTGRKWETDQCW